MAKLYPPQLEGTVPAFYGDSITVPFAMNRAVSASDIKSFSLLIKTIQTGQTIETIKSFNFDLNNGIVIFKVSDKTKYNIGQSYKIQLAYIDINNQIGHYSTVSVLKYTVEPSIEIDGLLKSNSNNHIYNYTGIYKTTDPTEKMYSCCFNVYDSTYQLIQTTGEIIHNSFNDEAPKEIGGKLQYTASEQFNLNLELIEGKNYYIQFLVKTIGLMELDTGKYQIRQAAPIPLKKELRVNPILDYDNGCISINISYFDDSPVRGKFLLQRSSSENSFQSWDQILTFTINNEYSKTIWKDFTIKQGVFYKYAVIMVDGRGNYSTKSISEIIMADFEDMFLFDGDKQLRIRFNPKVTSFKNVIQETKTDTIGGKYPYVFRNGQVNYKEFPISGLLSHLTDDEGYFNLAFAQQKYNDNLLSSGQGKYSTYLNSENFAAERDFKQEVLDWLANGKPKLFRSPAEGNYIVRLMNSSLAPTDPLSRMLHTFTSTAYEIATNNHENLLKFEIIKDNLLIGVNKIMEEYTMTYPLNKLTDKNFIEENNLSNIIGISFNITSNKNTFVEINKNDINVKLTSRVTIPIEFLKKSILQNGSYSATDTFTVVSKKEIIPNINNDDTINSAEYVDIPVLVFQGATDMYKNINEKRNLIDKFIKLDRDRLSQIFSIRCVPRNFKTVYTDDWTTFYDYPKSSGGNKITIDKNSLYSVWKYDNSVVNKFLGYYDQGESLKVSDNWNFTASDLYQLQIVNEAGLNKVIKNWSCPTKTEISEADLNADFTNLGKIKMYGSLLIKIIVSCRVSSINFKETDEYQGYLDQFSTMNNIDTQAQLDNLLIKIQEYLQ